jgi:EAL domain-containing protein (putative c-di-GMP-specific phosphodiesterase class I)
MRLSAKIETTVRQFLCEGEFFAPSTNNSFFVFMKGSSETVDKRLCECLDSIAYIMAHDKCPMKLSFVCGTYVVTGREKDVSEIINNAESARRAADKRDSCVTEFAPYTTEIYNEVMRRSTIENDLYAAVANKEFIIEVQPKFDLKTGECVSAEALVRWMHPILGRICPDEFIPIAEKTGAVIDIDMYVLETVCQYIRNWMDAGFNPVPVAVNQSRLHITDPNYVDSVFAVFQEYDIWPNLIILETTESIAFNDYASVTEILKRLHDYGFILSMDDFGSGYSSLYMLNELEYDELKLDQKLLGVGKDCERHKILLRHLIEMAHDMNMTVVAEGVETEEQKEVLLEAGCDVVQGFLYSYPLSIDKFEASVFGRVLPEEYDS